MSFRLTCMFVMTLRYDISNFLLLHLQPFYQLLCHKQITPTAQRIVLWSLKMIQFPVSVQQGEKQL